MLPFNAPLQLHLKFFWTLFKNVHFQGPCSLKPYISRPYCINISNIYPLNSAGEWGIQTLTLKFLHYVNLSWKATAFNFTILLTWLDHVPVVEILLKSSSYNLVVTFSSFQRNLIKKISDWMYDCTDYKNDFDFFITLVKWWKIAVKKSHIFRKF